MKINKIVYIATFITLLGACKNSSTEGAKEADTHADEHEHGSHIELTAEQVKNAGIVLGSIEMRQLSGTIKATGVLDVPPQNLVSVTVTLGGFLQHTELLQGMQVSKGQVIATLKSNEYIQLQQDYIENRSRLEFLEAEYKRQELLAKDNVNALKTLQQSKADYEGTKAKAQGLRAKLQMAGAPLQQIEKGDISAVLNITSPISGYVTQVNVSLGAFISPGVEMFRIIDTKHLHAEIRVFERDLSKIKLGNLVHFSIAHETTDRKAHVYLIGREIEQDRTVRIHCHLDKEDPELLPGMFITATVETQSGTLPSLPNEAVVAYENKKYIFAFEGTKKEGDAEMNEYAMIEVTSGLSENGFTEVQLPTKTDMKELKVVTKGAYALLAKQFNSEEGGHGH
ncbi:MAG: efflux RND transporter periplasmic adaptor subunit [Bacteroidetes bacterium]|nr:MAG: efflux RND transporter periplasmic adaptor subunit [Bacteroidota bacterium]